MTEEFADGAALRNLANLHDAVIRLSRRHKELREREENLVLAIRELLRNYDEERGVIDCSPESWCPDCTLGTVPNHLNKRPCAYHYALNLLEEEN